EAVLENLRRPMPQRPGIAARQGTIFHSWVEEYFGSSGMLDFDETFDDDATADELDLPTLKENFLASDWAQRTPWALEYPLETPVEGVTVRGRIDAIFRSVDESGQETWQLVDWKTGRQPSAKDKRARAVQLALYRIGFARLHKIPLERVTASFFYAASGSEVPVEHLATEQEIARYLKRARDVGGKLYGSA
ncbi:MAG: PD-(D/E)XK nuclease family protein, partial [Rothia sp. (in: high G+C Gram-positive bacteria)]|nr:PD-(D/E)XK nuclease family protein [Rothia sp. (in: high G+C Gram-positive bacteria)]